MTNRIIVAGLTAAQVYDAIAQTKQYIMSHDDRDEPGAEERERRYMPIFDDTPEPLAGKSAHTVLIDDFEDVKRQRMRTPDPVEDPKPDPRRSRVTARGGRSDDWKGKRYVR